MKDIRRQFLLSSIENLRDLKAKISQTENFSQNFLNEIFRLLHTIKGTAQTFGLAGASRLSHQLENLLSAAKNDRIEVDKHLLLEGVESLIESLHDEDFEIPAILFEKIHDLLPNQTAFNISAHKLPEKILQRLSAQEKEEIFTALENGDDFLCLEAGFSFAEFGKDLKLLREELNQHGTVSAVFPGEKPGAEISFLILLSGRLSNLEIEKVASKFSADIVFQKQAALNFSENLQSIVEQITVHGKNTAWELGKNVEFETSVQSPNSSSPKTKIIFDALLHLIRNAVDHAIETPEQRTAKGKSAKGIIKIVLNEQDNETKITVTDDGGGIDLEKIRAKAIDEKIVSADKVLSEQETLDLIFQPGFSTAPNLTEISGRGVGLDAVKESVENAGGKINIKSRKDVGTTFEIFLP